MTDDARWMAAALSLARRAAGASFPNPNVGCILVRGDRVVARGWTQPGGRPHAEGMALDAAGGDARGATAYVTLEPCAHASMRGPACADSLIAARVARVVVAMTDPDPRTAGQGIARLSAAGIEVVEGVLQAECETELAGFIRRVHGKGPEVTLKLALSLDGKLALPDGRSQWITGPTARAHSHLERARADAVIVGRGTWEADRPAMTVRLPGWTAGQPQRAILTTTGSTASAAPTAGADAQAFPPAPVALANIAALDAHDWQRVLVEGGAQAAAALLRADRVDRVLLYRAPILVGAGPGLDAFSVNDLAEAHGRWLLVDRRPLGPDLLEEYRRIR